ncbi:MAG: exodeoxyribonuclease VII large subunit [Syntrophomonadaceae bacterium]|jgi:exodeoxyribonuclease VII large subunit
MQPKVISVSELNKFIGLLLESEPGLQDFWLRGEISGFKLYQQSGHMYFTLKDEESTVSAVMFKSRTRALKFMPENGMEVLARGSISVFNRQGKYQLYVDELQLFGAGSLSLYLQQLKERLEKQGYFNEDFKKPLPSFAQKVGVITSQDGAALQDILKVLRQRHAGIQVIFYHSSVQGVDAPMELVQGLRCLNTWGDMDVIIIGRGGGSWEDLMAFNSEEVVKAIFESQIPVISAVGHETDFTLADWVADVRAATPTQAAQLAVPDLQQLGKEIKRWQQRMQMAIEKIYYSRSESLDQLVMKRILKTSGLLQSLQSKEDDLQDLSARLLRAADDNFNRRQNQLAITSSGLDKLSPLKVLKRGYAVVRNESGVIRSVHQVLPGDMVQLILADGELKVKIEDRETGKRWKE